jgi:hypothetical protein
VRGFHAPVGSRDHVRARIAHDRRRALVKALRLTAASLPTPSWRSRPAALHQRAEAAALDRDEDSAAPDVVAGGLQKNGDRRELTEAGRKWLRQWDTHFGPGGLYESA